MSRRLATEMPRTRKDIELTHNELHDLCQPLTALQCGLEMSRILRSDLPSERVIDDALEETRRLFAVVERMRFRLAEIEQQSQGQPGRPLGAQ